MTFAQRFAAATPLCQIFQAADDVWSAELSNTFGKRAGDVRYRPEGKGLPDTELRRAYEAREAARLAYDTAMDF